MRMKETQADADVKDQLFVATRREIMAYAERFAAAHVRGQTSDSDAQHDIGAAAKIKGYPCGVIREMARDIRMIARAEGRKKPDPAQVHNMRVRLEGEVTAYRAKIGLGVGRLQ